MFSDCHLQIFRSYSYWILKCEYQINIASELNSVTLFKFVDTYESLASYLSLDGSVSSLHFQGWASEYLFCYVVPRNDSLNQRDIIIIAPFLIFCSTLTG